MSGAALPGLTAALCTAEAGSPLRTRGSVLDAPDVVVVGAGSAGLARAGCLALMGCTVDLCDEGEGPASRVLQDLVVQACRPTSSIAICVGT